MRRLIATKKGYVRRLRQMLPRDKPCECCPRFKHCDEVLEVMQDCEGTFLQEWCTSFVGLPPMDKKKKKICPCLQIGDKALVRAHAAIVAWDRGEHPWNKEDVE